MLDLDKRQMVDELVSGKLEPKNEFVEYLCDKANLALIDLDKVLAERNRLTQLVEQLRFQETRLRAELDSFGVAIADWQLRDEVPPNGREKSESNTDPPLET